LKKKENIMIDTKKKYVIELTDAECEVIHTGLCEVQDHADGEEYFTEEEYVSACDAFDNMKEI
jgi:hypothetical protein